MILQETYICLLTFILIEHYVKVGRKPFITIGIKQIYKQISTDLKNKYFFGLVSLTPKMAA